MSAMLEKPAVIEVDEAGHDTRDDVVGHIDAKASETSYTSFVHLDEKKILRKVCEYTRRDSC